MVTQQIAAVASAMLSAAKTPVTPQNFGRIMARGTSSMTFLSRAIKSEILAWPRAMNVFWQALCSPNMVIPERKYGIILSTQSMSSASFVNAEECEYLVIEDDFPNGRPSLENAGVYFTDRETVNKVEKMKVCTFLNPLHTALAVFGCLLGYTLISKEMQDPELSKLVKTIGYTEGLPVVVDPGIIEPKKFIDEVVNTRIPNPFMPDTPQRIATDTSQKLSIRFGETIKAYLASDKLDVNDLKCIPLVFAGWLRYVMGIDDEGQAFEPSADPLLGYAREALSGITLGYTGSLDQLSEILSNQKIFGVNLFEAGLADLVLEYFRSMIAGPGAVRATLKKVVG